MKGFDEFDHSGDIGIEARGCDMKELFLNAALGLFALIVTGGVEPRERRRVRIESSSWEDLLVDWLSEIVSCSSAYGEVYADASIGKIEEYNLEAELIGEKFDPARHRLRLEVKAATYHGLKVVREGNAYKARVVFDL